jgi:hypothetical protein
MKVIMLLLVGTDGNFPVAVNKSLTMDEIHAALSASGMKV